MSPSSGPRRAVVEILASDRRAKVAVVGNRSIHHCWSVLARHFDDVLLGPQRRSDDRGMTWAWKIPPAAPAPSAPALAELRRRLIAAAERFSEETAANPRGPEAPVAAAMKKLATRLAGEADARLAAYVALTESGPRLHSWGAAEPGRPYFPDEIECEVRGHVVVSEKDASGFEVVIENRKGVVLARTQSDAAGAFCFRPVGSGVYRVRVASGRINFPVSGIPVVVEHENVTGLRLLSSSLALSQRREDLAGEAAIEARASAGTSAEPRRHRGIFLAAGAVAAVALVALFFWPHAETSTPIPVVSEKTAESERATVHVRERAGDVSDDADSTSAVARSRRELAGPGRPGDRPRAAATSPDSDQHRATEMDPAAAASTSVRERGAMPTTPNSTITRDSAAAQNSPTNANRPAREPRRRAAGHDDDALIVSGNAGGGGDGRTGHSANGNARAVTGTGGTNAPDAPARGGTENLTAAPPPVGGGEAVTGSGTEDASASPVRGQVAPGARRGAGGGGETSVATGPVPPPTSTGTLTTAGGGETPHRPERAPATIAPGTLPRDATGEGRPKAENSRSAGESTQPAEPKRLTADEEAGERPKTVADVAGATNAAANETPQDIRPGRTAPENPGRLAQLRVSDSGWQPRLLADVILPTPVAIDASDEAVGALRARVRQERDALRPEALRHPVLWRGFVLEFPADAGAARWVDADGLSPEESVVTGRRAEIAWRESEKPRGGGYVLIDATGRELARAAADAGGELLLRCAPEVSRRWWIGFERGASTMGGTAPHFRWRLPRNQPLPAAWHEDDQWHGGRGVRVELPGSPLSGAGLALVDEVSGWGLVGRVGVATEWIDPSSARLERNNSLPSAGLP